MSGSIRGSGWNRLMEITRIPPPEIILRILMQFWPVWALLALILGAGFVWRKRLGLYGQIHDSRAGRIGLALCLFWLFTAILAPVIAPFDPLAQLAALKSALPGAVDDASGQV